MKKIILFILFLNLFPIIIHAEDQVCFKDHCASVELALTPQEHARGLQFRKVLKADQGMLFIFNESGHYSFWMKDTKIPLDMIWLNKDGEVVSIAEKVYPCESDPCPTYTPTGLSKYVLELNAGMADKWGLKEKDALQFHLKIKE